MKMLMEIDPLPMRGSLVMMLVMISPSRREVSPPPEPRGGGVSSRKLAHEFFQEKTLHIAEDGHRRPTRGRALLSPGQGVGPLAYFFCS